MTKTYDATSRTDTNRVREFLGDTGEAAIGFILHNETIAEVVTNAGNLAYAAATCCEMIAGQMALRPVSKGMDDMSKAMSDPAFWLAKAKAARAGGAGALLGGDGSGIPTALVYGGGQSVADRNTLAQDSDRIMGPAAVGRDDPPGEPNGVQPAAWSPWGWSNGS